MHKLRQLDSFTVKDGDATEGRRARDASEGSLRFSTGPQTPTILQHYKHSRINKKIMHEDFEQSQSERMPACRLHKPQKKKRGEESDEKSTWILPRSILFNPADRRWVRSKICHRGDEGEHRRPPAAPLRSNAVKF